jgi:NTE family protein
MSDRRHKASGKTALVLAGGGVTGAVYEIGALRAIDDLLVDRTVNDFDIYVGTSAGSLVTSLLANGISPEAMLQVFRGVHPEIRTIQGQDILKVRQRDLLNWGRGIPRGMVGIAQNFIKHPEDLSFFELVWSLAELAPAGLYDSGALEGYVREVLSLPGHTDDFRQLQRELYLVTTDLNSGDRTVFSNGTNSDVPISLAVSASTALPPVYRPVHIKDRVYVDGGLRGTASLDLAVEHGASLIVCINPVVPYNDGSWSNGPFFQAEGGYLSKKGMQGLLSQVSRITTHAGLHYQIKQIRRGHPDVDIIVIEPRPDDCQMFYYNIMRYSVLLLLARHGFESVTLNLAEDYPDYKSTLARHGIPISRRLVIDELKEIQESGYDPEVVRRVLEKRSAACNRLTGDAPLCELNRALAELEMALDELADPASELVAA